ncbi:MAG TPA: (d)CMP kinase [Gammaproteobacteria bacterium]|nr:(d)CMP kinase [Gammaproteobacteria bacterium]
MNDTSNIPVLTIDGPSGVGKGTAAVRIARLRNWHYLDSGALYRALAVAARQQHVTVGDGAAIAEVASQLSIACELNEMGDGCTIFLNSEDVTAQVRTESVAAEASVIAASREARAALLLQQRAQCQWPGLVADGRDMGRMVFPQALLKIFLVADARIRAKRRYKQLKAKGFDGSLPDLVFALQQRDTRDTDRAASPLLPAGDAVVIDTSEMSIEAVVSDINRRLGNRLSN